MRWRNNGIIVKLGDKIYMLKRLHNDKWSYLMQNYEINNKQIQIMPNHHDIVWNILIMDGSGMQELDIAKDMFHHIFQHLILTQNNDCQ